MNVSQAAAGRPRRVEGSVFFSDAVMRITPTRRSPLQSATPYAWKRTIEDRIWSMEGPSTLSARAVLVTILRHADATGRTWISIATIRAKTGIGTARTVRSALETLAREGWLQIMPQTWASLTAEQTAAGRPAPRRDDVGQAPNLYVVLDSQLAPPNPTSAPASAHPGLARIASKAPPTPGQNGTGGSYQNGTGEPLANLHSDLDPTGSGSMKEWVGSGATATGAHTFSKHRHEGQPWTAAWNLLVAAHVVKTEAKFGLAPSKPDVPLVQQQAMADCLIRAATQVGKKLEQRGIHRDASSLQQDLAEHVMRHYFKHDSEHLKRVKWALRDLGREIDARMIEAMQSLVRESREPMESASTRQVSEDKPISTRIETIETLQSVPVDNAREARRIIAMLEAKNMTRV